MKKKFVFLLATLCAGLLAASAQTAGSASGGSSSTVASGRPGASTADSTGARNTGRDGVPAAVNDSAAPNLGATSGAASTSRPHAVRFRPSAPISVTQPPPPAAPEVRTASPGENYTWVPGSYTWRNNQWQWTSGQWTVPPRPGATWVPGSYDAASQQWTEGHWSTDSTQARRPNSGPQTPSTQR